MREYEIKNNRVHANSIFIGNLPYSVQWWELKDHFQDAGDVVRADTVTSRGRPKGMGTVEFRTRDMALEAIKRYDRTTFMGREIFVREDLPPPEKSDDREFTPRRRDDDYRSRREISYRDGRDRDRDNHRSRDYPPLPAEGCEIFVGNLPFSTRTEDLKDLLRHCGDIERADIKTTYNGKSRGFGTVVFADPESAKKAIEEFNGFELDGRRIDVRAGKFFLKEGSIAGPQGSRLTSTKNTEFTEGVSGKGDPSDTIYVSNLPWETSDSDLVELFGSIATVSKAELQYDSSDRPSGNAVVQFADEDGAATAIAQLDNYEYGRRNLGVSYAKKPEAAASAPFDAAVPADVEEPVVSAPVDDIDQDQIIEE
ncbi:unnamed protein product [Ambrosiozyma monospora]|uniref:Unnamed protein product n=1 Tax=Ambrosiozyma monospora TaxID=43982 RepID=A0A9W7DG15_AMBMO|nr:unnamed protein product [Ambrosiozyma monospora]